MAGDAAGAAEEVVGSPGDGDVASGGDGSGGPDPRWRYETGGWPNTPTLADGTLFVPEGFGGDALHAVDVSDGTRRWRFESGYYLFAPTVTDDVVYVGGGTGAHALDRSDGSERWHVDPSGYGTSGLALADGVLFTGTIGSAVYALATDDGSVRWEFPVGDNAFRPTVVDGTVYVGSQEENYANDGAETGAVYAIDATDGTELWRYDVDRPVESTPTVVDDTVYVDGFALSADVGAERWAASVGQVRTDPVVVDGTVYVGSDDDSVYALSTDDGSVEWEFETGENVRSTPAVVDGTAYVGSSDGNTYALDADEGTEQWRFERDASVQAGITVVDDAVIVPCTDNTVYALPANPA